MSLRNARCNDRDKNCEFCVSDDKTIHTNTQRHETAEISTEKSLFLWKEKF